MSILLWIFSAVGSIVWIALLLYLWRHRGLLRQLRDEPASVADVALPSAAVVFAARDEEAMIERAARSMLGQDYPGLTVAAVDDRSTDATGAILDRLAEEFPRLKVVHVRELPDGWLGKTWAMQSASEAVDADWILFTDGDVVLSPDALRKAVAAAVRHGADHIVVGPEVPLESWGERMFLCLFGLYLSIDRPIAAVESPRSPVGFGVGAFNLVRAKTFRAVGGFRRLALSVDDDLKLGDTIKRAGYVTRVYLGKGTVSVRWQTSLRGMITGLEKNFFAGLGYSLPKAVLATLFILATGVGPALGLIFGPPPVRAVSAAGLISLALLLRATSDHSRIRWYYVATAPLGSILMTIALWRSTILTLVRGGVRWRDTLYPLDRLRKHRREREEWLREIWLSTRP